MLAVALDIDLRELWSELSGFLLQQLNHPYHFVVEAVLVLFIFYLLFQTSYKFKPRSKEALTEAEIKALLDEWQPEPLVKTTVERESEFDDVPSSDRSTSTKNGSGTLEGEGRIRQDSNLCVEGAVGARVNIVRYTSPYANPPTATELQSHRISVGSNTRFSKTRSAATSDRDHATVKLSEQYVNMATAGFLNLATHPEVINAGVASIEKYGVGSCGPRGFYGTLDVHLQLEEKIAEFMGYDQAVLFSSGFATIASVIPAFSKSGDYLICDKGLSLAAQTGIKLSRSEVIWFNHNDLKDLKRALESLRDVFRKKQRKVFVVIEGLYTYYGDLAPLPDILELKKEYPFRVILDESYSIGVLGVTGRGVTQHFNIAEFNGRYAMTPNGERLQDKIEIITASIGHAVGGIGGFSVGSTAICNHQRLNCSGYVFSCSLPPFISSAVMKALELINSGKVVRMLSDRVQYLHEALKELHNEFVISSHPASPLVHLRLRHSTGSRAQDERLLQRIVDEIFAREKIILQCAKYAVQHERFLPDRKSVV